MRKKPIKVLVVDDHAVVRIGLRNLINDEPDLHVIAEAGSCVEAMEMAALHQPNVIVLDLRLPDRLGLEIIEELKIRAVGTRVLILTSFADDSLLLSALKTGADGYLKKDITEGELVDSIRRLVQGGAVAPLAASNQTSTPIESVLSKQAPWIEALTGQERRVFELVGRGYTNRQVAQSMHLAEKTVRNYLARVFDKIGVRRRSEIVALYISNKPWKTQSQKPV